MVAILSILLATKIAFSADVLPNCVPEESDNTKAGFHVDFYTYPYGSAEGLKDSYYADGFKTVGKLTNSTDGVTDLNFYVHPKRGETVDVYGIPVIGSNFAMQITGWFRAPQTGQYMFNVSDADDGLSFQLGFGNQRAEKCCSDVEHDIAPGYAIYRRNVDEQIPVLNVSLVKGGYYPVRMVYYQRWREARISIKYTMPDGTNRTTFDMASDKKMTCRSQASSVFPSNLPAPSGSARSLSSSAISSSIAPTSSSSRPVPSTSSPLPTSGYSDVSSLNPLPSKPPSTSRHSESSENTSILSTSGLASSSNSSTNSSPISSSPAVSTQSLSSSSTFSPTVNHTSKDSTSSFSLTSSPVVSSSSDFNSCTPAVSSFIVDSSSAITLSSLRPSAPVVSPFSSEHSFASTTTLTTPLVNSKSLSNASATVNTQHSMRSFPPFSSSLPNTAPAASVVSSSTSMRSQVPTESFTCSKAVTISSDSVCASTTSYFHVSTTSAVNSALVSSFPETLTIATLPPTTNFESSEAHTVSLTTSHVEAVSCSSPLSPPSKVNTESSREESLWTTVVTTKAVGTGPSANNDSTPGLPTPSTKISTSSRTPKSEITSADQESTSPSLSYKPASSLSKSKSSNGPNLSNVWTSNRAAPIGRSQLCHIIIVLLFYVIV